MNQEYIKWIGIGIAGFVALLIMIIVIVVLAKKSKKRRLAEQARKNSEFVQVLTDFGKYNEAIYLPKQTLKFEEGQIHDIAPLLLSKNGIFVLYHLVSDAKIEGNCLEREWVKKEGNKKKIFPSPIMKIDENIKLFSKYLPAGIPIYSLLVIVGDNKEALDIYNVPGYLVVTPLNELMSNLMAIKEQAPVKLTRQNLIELNEMFRNMSVQAKK
ncbi:hypothetical protein JN00_0183 [Metamycoplasma subdolum]|uniref:NERD domain-containing protein n=1 Tax=Metamycoplasma subdolum TaxID=92407 RepID=A0A3M0A1S5_9BACT|nr:nuclease-related domain-containing protein [Metamycoplasma subdolum]RMA79131.1 hypothetical protein JN00_0183 [Metamycoplasma subdolum]WPB50653.1 nuclease-related domain-containing protein [Metamycoplasma subdolum]